MDKLLDELTRLAIEHEPIRLGLQTYDYWNRYAAGALAAAAVVLVLYVFAQKDGAA